MGSRVHARSCAHVGNWGKSPSRSHSSYTSSSGKPSKRFLSTQAGGCGGPCGRLTLLGACHSGEGSLLTLLGLGRSLCLGGLNQGQRSAEVTVGHCRLTASPYHGGNFVWNAHHYHSPSILSGAASRRHPSATLGVSRLSTAGVAAWSRLTAPELNSWSS